MKKYIPYLVIFLIGAFAGMWAHRQYHFRDEVKMPQNDTIVRLDTIRYSRLELSTNSSKLEIPKIDMPELVYVPSDSTTIIYRDSIRYITLPRQYFFTETEDAKIWHSGVNSTIDSLVIFRENVVVSKKEIATKRTKRHGLSIGVEVNYATAPNFPVQLEYSFSVKPWLNVYGYAEYELLRGQVGVGIGTQLQIGW